MTRYQVDDSQRSAADLVAERQQRARHAEREGQVALPGQDRAGSPCQEGTADGTDYQAQADPDPHPRSEGSTDRYRRQAATNEPHRGFLADRPPRRVSTTTATPIANVDSPMAYAR